MKKKIKQHLVNGAFVTLKKSPRSDLIFELTDKEFEQVVYSLVDRIKEMNKAQAEEKDSGNKILYKKNRKWYFARPWPGLEFFIRREK